MRYLRWTRIKCVLFAFVLTVLSVFFAFCGYKIGSVACAVVPSALMIYFGFIAVSAYRETSVKQTERAELERKLAECDIERRALEAERRKVFEAHVTVLRSESELQMLIREARTIHREVEGRKRTRNHIRTDN